MFDFRGPDENRRDMGETRMENAAYPLSHIFLLGRYRIGIGPLQAAPSCKQVVHQCATSTFLDVTMAGSTTRRVLLLVAIMRCIRADVPVWPASGVCVAKRGTVAQPERENIGI